MKDGKINPSTIFKNPKDAKMGDGVYLTNIKPGTKTNAKLGLTFKSVPNQNLFTNYVKVSTKGLKVQQNVARPNVFYVANSTPLKIEGVSFGLNWFK